MNTLQPLAQPAYATYTAATPNAVPQDVLTTSQNPQINLLRGAIAGGASAYFRGDQMTQSMRTLVSGGLSGIPTGLKGIAGTAGQLAGVSALGSAFTSSLRNGVGLALGKVDKADIAQNIARDSLRGALAGASGGTVAGVVGFLPVQGLMGAVLKVSAGAIGGMAGGRLADHLSDRLWQTQP